jgi:Uri superfamily endonuclease
MARRSLVAFFSSREKRNIIRLHLKVLKTRIKLECHGTIESGYWVYVFSCSTLVGGVSCI